MLQQWLHLTWATTLGSVWSAPSPCDISNASAWSALVLGILQHGWQAVLRHVWLRRW